MPELDFFERTLAVVKTIPFGRVTTYGAIAKALGAKSSSRMVGWALNSVRNRDDIPCHRVLNRNGELSGKHHFAGPNLMKDLLIAEGIEFIEERVDIKKYFWEPETIIPK